MIVCNLDNVGPSCIDWPLLQRLPPTNQTIGNGRSWRCRSDEVEYRPLIHNNISPVTTGASCFNQPHNYHQCRFASEIIGRVNVLAKCSTWKYFDATFCEKMINDPWSSWWWSKKSCLIFIFVHLNIILSCRQSVVKHLQAMRQNDILYNLG